MKSAGGACGRIDPANPSVTAGAVASERGSEKMTNPAIARSAIVLTVISARRTRGCSMRSGGYGTLASRATRLRRPIRSQRSRSPGRP